MPASIDDRALVERLWRDSLDLGIMAVDFADGYVLQAIAHVVASMGGSLFIDAGAGIGFSTYWIIKGVSSGCQGGCRVVAIEYLQGRLERLASNVKTMGEEAGVRVEAVSADALDYISGLGAESIDYVFVDIEKESYPLMLRLLEARLSRKGVAIFHNAFHPRPPEEFFQALSRGPWITSTIPTSAGIVVAVRK